MMKEKTEHRSRSADYIRCQRYDRGFTLVEVMIAMVVLLLGMLGVMGMQYYAITGNTSSREVRMATNFSSETIEQLKSSSYNSIVTQPKTYLFGELETSARAAISGRADSDPARLIQRKSWVVIDCVAMDLNADDNTCDDGLIPTCISDPDATMSVPVKAVRVRTCWTDKDGLPHAVTLDSIRWNENGTI